MNGHGAHVRIDIAASGLFYFDLFEGASFTGGTELLPVARNRIFQHV